MSLSELPQFREEVSEEELAAEVEKDLGTAHPHWSGIDLTALLAEFERGDTRAAGKLLLESAASSGVENALLLLLLEVGSSDDFRPHAKQLRTIARKAVSVRGSDDSSARKMLKARVFQECLRDEEAAASIYRKLKGRKGRLSEVAFRKLEHLEKKRKQRLSKTKDLSLPVPDTKFNAMASPGEDIPVIRPPVDELLNEREGE